MMDAAKLIGEILALGLTGEEIVLVRSHEGLHTVYELTRDQPMVRAYNSGFAPYVFGRKNARRHICLEVNLASYPTIKQARLEAYKVSTLITRLQGFIRDGIKSSSEGSDVLARAVHKGGKLASDMPTYFSIQSVSSGLVPKAGRLELQSRGGVAALILGVL